MIANSAGHLKIQQYRKLAQPLVLQAVKITALQFCCNSAQNNLGGLQKHLPVALIKTWNHRFVLVERFPALDGSTC